MGGEGTIGRGVWGRGCFFGRLFCVVGYKLLACKDLRVLTGVYGYVSVAWEVQFVCGM